MKCGVLILIQREKQARIDCEMQSQKELEKIVEERRALEAEIQSLQESLEVLHNCLHNCLHMP